MRIRFISLIAALIFSFSGSDVSADSFFVSVGTNGKGVYSDDSGETWTISNPGGGTLFAVGYGQGVWVAFGSNRAIFSEDGGQTWQAATTSPTGAMLGVTFANGRFVAVGENGRGAYSDDLGRNWTDTVHNNGNMRGVAHGDGRFVAVGLGGVASYSLDGINWVTSNHNNGQMTSVAFGNGVFVAVDGGGGSLSGHISYSTDGGTTWNDDVVVPSIGNTRSVVFGAGRFVTVGYGRYRYSNDGITWSDAGFDDGELPNTTNSVAYGNGRFVAIGDAEGVYSADGAVWFRSAPHGNSFFQPLSNGLAYGETTSNEAPVADAGPDQAARAGDTVHLDGSGSFDDNTPAGDLAYSWVFASKPASSSATLSGANTASASFVVDVLGTYVVSLTVSDEAGLVSEADQVLVSADNLAPTAAAGEDRLVLIGDTVTLDGSGSSDPEGDPLEFDWEFASTPAGSAATLDAPDSVSPSFVPDVTGDYWVNLTVSDFLGPGTTDTVLITAAAAEDYAELQILSADELVCLAGTEGDDFTTRGNNQAFCNFLRQAVSAIQKLRTDHARTKLEMALVRTDGCILGSAPEIRGPGRDWVTDCATQSLLYQRLSDAIDALSSL